jgi:hypothetical protein
MSQYTISGIAHIISLLNKYPQLIALSSLTPIKEIAKSAQQAVRRSGCGCSATEIYAKNMNVFERSLDMMGYGDHLIVKNILKVDKICYYAKDKTGHRVLKCI